MGVTVELLPEVEASLSRLAAQQGLSLSEYVRHLLEQLPGQSESVLSAAERAEAWRRSAGGLPRTPPLSDHAISRESMYDARG